MQRSKHPQPSSLDFPVRGQSAEAAVVQQSLTHRERPCGRWSAASAAAARNIGSEDGSQSPFDARPAHKTDPIHRGSSKV